MFKVALYASNHGFGHATRVAALAEALNRFDIFTWICTDRPEFLFASLRPGFYAVRTAKLDCGVVHGHNLVPDLSATKEALLGIMHSRLTLVAAEVEFLRSENIDFVIADIPFLIVEACEYAGIPVFGISNFDWAFIYAELYQDDPSMLPVVNTIKSLYHRLDAAFSLPFGEPKSVPGFRHPVQCGLLARECQDSMDVSDEYHLESDQPRLCVLFGGEGDMEINWEPLCQAWPGYVISPNSEVKAENHIYAPAQENYVRIIQQSQALLCKPGYGSFSEAIQFGKPIIYLPRANYPEERVLLAGLQDYPVAIQLSAAQLSLSQWQHVFSLVIGADKIPARPAANLAIAGAVIAAYLRARYPEDRILTVCDLGSNNLNLCLYNKSREQVLHKVTLETGAGKNVRSGKITARGLQQARKQLTSALEIDKAVPGAKHLIATGVFRQVSNSEDLLEWLRSSYGFRAKIISAKKEAYYASLAAGQCIDPKRSTMVVDIGGYSTEFILQHAGQRRDYSLELGLIELNKMSQAKLEDSVKQRLLLLDLSNPDVLFSIGLSAALMIKAIDCKSDFEMMDTNLAGYTREQLHELQRRLTGASGNEKQVFPALRALTSIYLLLLDRFALDKIMVLGDGISVGYAKEVK